MFNKVILLPGTCTLYTDINPVFTYRFRVLDHDTYSAHDAIGKVYIDLNPLLVREHGTMISGWFPIYDTMHGIRGELSIIVKVDLFSDFNRFRQSSCGVHFFCSESNNFL